MKVLDPTYLRYVFDGLRSEVIKKEDHSSLPAGHIGIYEKLFSDSSGLIHRKKVLEFFTAWSLLKREVTTEFVAKIIDWEDEDVLDYVNRYSRFFNTISANNYILYHDSLRIFTLQYATEKIIEQVIASLNQLQIDEPNDYCRNYLNDHNFSLAFKSENYADKCLGYLNSLYTKSNSGRSDIPFIHRAFDYGAHILNFRNDVESIKKLYIQYDELINSPVSIEKENLYFNILGVDYLIKKGNAIGNPNVTVLFWIYFIDKFSFEQDLNPEKLTVISILVKETNEYLFENSEIKTTILTTNYLNYINQKLLDLGQNIILYKPKYEGVPWILTDSGHDEGILENSEKYFSQDFKNYNFHFDDLLIKFNHISILNLKNGEAKKIIQKLFQIIEKEKYDILYNTLNKFRLHILLNSAENYDDLINYDDFLFRLFISCVCLNKNFKLKNFENLFITAKKLYVVNMCLWETLINISNNGSIKNNYRKISIENNYSAHTDYIIDEMTSIMYVLGLKNRKESIIELIKLFIEEVTSVKYYHFHNDLVHSQYHSPNPDLVKINLILEFYKNNKTESHELSSLLCLHIPFMELISMQIYNSNEQSEVGQNFRWAYFTIDAIYKRLNKDIFLNYLLNGFERYISVMGPYALNEHRLEYELPKENVWRIEWWMMCNFYASVTMNDQIDASIKNRFISKIDLIFKKNKYNRSINLNEGLNAYQRIRIESYERKDLYKKVNLFEFNFHASPIHYIRSFSQIKYDKSKINKIAGSIKNGNCILSHNV